MRKFVAYVQWNWYF